MPFFKLKAGSHVVGDGAGIKYFSANDPLNNVVESKDDLAAADPGKFERIEQPSGQAQARGLYGVEQPPGPSSGTDAQLQALAVQPMTQDEMKTRIKQLRELAEQLEGRAQQAQGGGGGQEGEKWRQAAEQHGQGPAAQQDDPAHPGRGAANLPSATGAGQARAPESQQKERDLEEAKRQEQQARAQQEQQRAQQAAQQRQGQAPAQQGQQGQPQGQQAPPAKQEPPKFSQLPPERQREEDAKLERLNLAQLREVAEDEEVELPANASKAQILHAIRQSRK